MNLPARIIKVRDELSKSYPQYYELRYMNADTPPMSGSHYLTHGYKEGFNACFEEMKELIEAIDDFMVHITDTALDGNAQHYIKAVNALKKFRGE